MTPFVNSNGCPPEIFDRCCDDLWNAQDSRYKHYDNERAIDNIYLMMRSYVQPQIIFQRAIKFDFIRWPALLSRLDVEHPSRRLFVNRFGMSPERFICICYVLHALALNGSLVFNLDYFRPLIEHFGDSFTTFLNEFARDLPGLRLELRQELCRRLAEGKPARPLDEPREIPWVTKFPLLRLANNHARVWHPLIFAQGMESAVHKRLSERGQTYTQDFSKVFENYVLELIDEAGLKYFGEATYKEQVGKDKHAVEAIITIGKTNVFVESKLMAYSNQLTTTDRAPLVWTELRRVREAMRQGWLVSAQLRMMDVPAWSCTRATEDFLIVVTSQPINASSGEHLKRMFRDNAFNPVEKESPCPTFDQLSRLPLKNILLTSIDEFEHLIGCVINKEITLVEFLHEIAEANMNPAMAAMFMDQYLVSKTKAWYQPRALIYAREAAEETLTGAFNTIGFPMSSTTTND